MENSKIEWTNHTFNPWHGCMKVSDGCKHCYAETLDNRWNGGHWGPNSNRKPMSEAYWNNPFKWDKAASIAGVKAKVFCASMADVFEDHPEVIEWRKRLFRLIDATPNLIWQLLTKRPENILRLCPDYYGNRFWPDNLWIGTSVENQAAADERIPHLLKVPSLVRFLSCEPLLGPIDFSNVNNRSDWKTMLGKESLKGINWIIVGGESGHNARPMNPQWARSILNQCKASEVPFFFKQWGEYGHDMQKVGKKLAGSLLDDKEYKEFP